MDEILKVDKNDVKGIRMPIKIFFNEAIETALAMQNHWEASKTRPGMVVMADFMSLADAIHLISLAGVGTYIQGRIIFLNTKTSEKKELMERAFFIFSEIKPALEFILDDGVTESADHALAGAKSRLSEDHSVGTVVQGLVDLSEIAEEKKDQLRMLGDFDLNLIEEAKELAKEIGLVGPVRIDDEVSENIKLRNRVCHLVNTRVREIRRAARYVFRKHPDIVRKFTSTYQRRRRLENRRKKLANKTVNISNQPEI